MKIISNFDNLDVQKKDIIEKCHSFSTCVKY